MGVYGNVCAIVIWTLEPRDAGEWDCVLNVEGYKLDTRKKLNLRLKLSVSYIDIVRKHKKSIRALNKGPEYFTITEMNPQY